MLAWIALAKRPETRARRVEATAAAAQRGERANEPPRLLAEVGRLWLMATSETDLLGLAGPGRTAEYRSSCEEWTTSLDRISTWTGPTEQLNRLSCELWTHKPYRI